MRIAIVDDMEQDRQHLHSMVSAFLESQQISVDFSLFSSGESFLEAYSAEEFSLLLLDLYMDGISGMDVAHKVREHQDSCPLVFVTSSDDYAIEGYEVDALGYILKPIQQDDLDRVLRKWLNNLGQVTKNITITVNNAPLSIPLDSIQWMDHHQNMVQFHTDKGLIRSYMTFERLLELLESEERFLLCYKGCLVNMDRIVGTDSHSFIVESGDSVPIRKRGTKQLKQQYIQYSFSHSVQSF